MGFLKKRKDRKENELRLRKLHGREVRYVTARDQLTNVEAIIGRYGEIKIESNDLSVICAERKIFSHSIEGLWGSELMSLDGIILSYFDERKSEKVEIIAYYKYHRK